MEIVEKRERKNIARTGVQSTMNLINGTYDLESRITLIQQLIPIGLVAVEEALQTKVQEFVGVRLKSYQAFQSDL